MAKPLIIVPGGLNTDIIGLGVEKLLHPGELTLGGTLTIGPGGKARNMAQMAAAFLGAGRVAMIGRSSRDPFGLWKIPIDSLVKAGVDIRHVTIVDFKDAKEKYPGIALIPVDAQGRNQIYVLPGVNADFSPSDIDAADELFENHDNHKVMLVALEIPPETARYAIDKAFAQDIRVIVDPGGIQKADDVVLNEKIFLLKPNEHEAEILTGIPIKDFDSAQKAARIIMTKGVQNILITHSANGAYLFTQKTHLHLPVPAVTDSADHDETGCGDQVSALMAALIAEGNDLIASAGLAVFGGTLQFYKAGIQPISRTELLDTV